MEQQVERRIVTVLFADLVGFTTLSEQFDPEDIAVIQDRYFATVRETIGRYGGRLEKFIGDAAMAVFGVPVSTDDDAVRAVRAGLALIGGIQQIGAALGLEEEALRVRVGINTGEAVTAESGPDEGRVTGDTVNTAARLQTAAPPGGVLVGETTALAVAEVAELGEPTPLELKGKAEPTNARLVTGLRAEPSREQAMGDLRAPTLGREGELESLTEARSRVPAGQSELWLIIAPPGVGKSRLLREFADRLRDSAGETVVWRSRARPDSVSPFDPIARLLIEALGTANRDEAATGLAGALASAGVSDARAGVVLDACLSVGWPAVTSAGSSDTGAPSSDRASLFAAWLEGLDALAGGATQVWLVEDVHWAGGDILAFLTEASSAARGGRLVVATARPSLLEASSEWAAEDAAAGRHTMQLGALAATDARALVAALVGDALPDDLVERIAERSDGNCLFIEELLRTWVSVGTLARDDAGNWRLTVPTDAIPLPASVQSIYAAQLDDLPPDARRLARRASVAGRRFPVGALQPLGATADAAHPEAGLEPLQRRELVVGPLTEPLWGEAFAYRHALLRDAGYASLARAERARLHIRLAKWLEEAAGDRSTEVAEQIAGHYSAALESAPALSQELDTGLDRAAVSRLAADWYERAGQSTLQLSAHDAARQLLKRSIDLTAEDSDLDAARRWERLGDATAFAADMDEGAAAYQKAMDFYRKAIDKGTAGFDHGSRTLEAAADHLTNKFGWLASVSPEGAKALAAGADELRAGSAEFQAGKRELEDALGLAQSGLARASSSLADVKYQQLRFAEGRDLATSTMEEIGDLDDASEARLLIARARSTMGAEGFTDQVESDVQRATELARLANDERTELSALRALAAARSEKGENDPRAWLEIEDIATRLGEWHAAAGAATNASVMRLETERAEATTGLRRARETAQAHGLTEDVGWAGYAETELHFLYGDWDQALRVGGEILDIAERNGYLRLQVRTIHCLIPMAAVRGEHAVLTRAQQFYDSLVGKFEFPDSPYSRVIRSAQDVELAQAGLRPKPDVDVESRIHSFEDDPSGPSWATALDRLVRFWVDEGRAADAALAVDALNAVLPGIPFITPLGQGTVSLLNGRVALARADAELAAKHAVTALAQFKVMPAPWWVAKAIRLLERAGNADEKLLGEAAEIERRLGAIVPTR